MFNTLGTLGTFKTFITNKKILQYLLLIGVVAWVLYQQFFSHISHISHSRNYEDYNSIEIIKNFCNFSETSRCEDVKENFNFNGEYCGVQQGAREPIEIIPNEPFPHVPSPRHHLTFSGPENHIITNQESQKHFPFYWN